MICTWTGIAKDVKKHLQTSHNDLCDDHGDLYCLFLTIPNASSYSYYKFLFAYNEIFFYRLQIQRGIMFLVLHYIGLAVHDLKYKYIVTVTNNEDTESVVVTHLARRFTETEDYMSFTKNCLKLHCDHTDRFTDEDGDLTVSLEILRVDE